MYIPYSFIKNLTFFLSKTLHFFSPKPYILSKNSVSFIQNFTFLFKILHFSIQNFTFFYPKPYIFYPKPYIFIQNFTFLSYFVRFWLLFLKKLCKLLGFLSRLRDVWKKTDKLQFASWKKQLLSFEFYPLNFRPRIIRSSNMNKMAVFLNPWFNVFFCNLK